MPYNIDSIPKYDPKAFWDKSNNLGPNTIPGIPLAVNGKDCNVTDNINEVLNKWMHDFSKLYNQGIANDYDDDFLKEAMEMKKEFEKMHDNAVDNEQDAKAEEIMNREITIDKVKKVIFKANNKKSPVIDEVPNEVFKE